MTKFINSREAFSSSLSLWNDRPTQVAVEEVYDLKVWPVTNILNEGPINFVIPPQPKGLMDDVHIVTKFRIEKANVNLGEEPSKNISVVNNFANSLWGNVDVQFDDRVDIMQSMRNSYPYMYGYEFLILCIISTRSSNCTSTLPHKLLAKLLTTEIFLLGSSPRFTFAFSILNFVTI